MFLLAGNAAGVVFADDHIHLVEHGVAVPACTVIIMSHTPDEQEVFAAVYDGDTFVRKQILPGNLTFYRLNGTLLDFSSWLEAHPSENYSTYVNSYISAMIVNSNYAITMSFPAPQDNKTHGGFLGMGGMVGSHRFFTVDIQMNTVTLTDVQTPNIPGFGLFVFLVAVSIVGAVWWKGYGSK